MSLFSTKADPAPVPAPVQTPPSIEDVFGGAIASEAYAKAVFSDAADELVTANVALDDVVLRATSEIDRLSDIRDEAHARRSANTATIERLEVLIGG